MRKLKLQMQMTLDGFVAGPNGEMDWAKLPWTEDIDEYVTMLTATIDTVVLGRKLAEGFIPYWNGVADDVDNPEQSSGKLFTDTQKIVFSKTIQESNLPDLNWKNTTLAKGDLVEVITGLKKQEGKDIIAYGGVDFVTALIKNKLIDEYYLFINPVAIGNGMPIFVSVTDRLELSLLHSKVFDCGIVVLQYGKLSE